MADEFCARHPSIGPELREVFVQQIEANIQQVREGVDPPSIEPNVFPEEEEEEPVAEEVRGFTSFSPDELYHPSTHVGDGGPFGHGPYFDPEYTSHIKQKVRDNCDRPANTPAINQKSREIMASKRTAKAAKVHDRLHQQAV